MCDFGATSPKPTVLFSNAPWIHKICEHARRPSDDERVTRLANLVPDVDGVLRPRGDGRLTESSAYPLGFGQAVANIFADNRVAWRHSVASCSLRKLCGCTLCPDVESLLTSPIRAGEDVGEDARLPGLLTLERQRACSSVQDVLVEQAIELDA